MNIQEIKELMAQFDASSLRDFSYKAEGKELFFSKNESVRPPSLDHVQVADEKSKVSLEKSNQELEPIADTDSLKGEAVTSPLVGVAYLSPSPDAAPFVSVGDTVKKGQTLLIIEAMKVMNEVPAPRDGVVTEVLVTNEEVVDFGKALVRLS